MKLILIILDGLSDIPPSTSLQKAKIPNLNFLAKNSQTGLLYPIKNIAPESGASQFVLLAQPLSKYPGRGILEALAVTKIKPNHTYARINFATFKNQKLLNIRSPILSKTLTKKINSLNQKIKIIPTIEYRGILQIKGKYNINNTHPGYKKFKNYSKAIPSTNKKTKTNLPFLNKFIKQFEKITKKTILIRGSSYSLPKLKPLKNFSLIAQTPVEIGLAKLLKMKILKPKNIIQQAISSKNNIYIQLKGPDTYGHLGNKTLKIKAIEKIDKSLKPLTKLKNTIICITSDHATPYQLKRHSSHPVPILIYNGKQKDSISKFTEQACKNGSLKLEGKNLLKLLLSKT